MGCCFGLLFACTWCVSVFTFDLTVRVLPFKVALSWLLGVLGLFEFVPGGFGLCLGIRCVLLLGA